MTPERALQIASAALDAPERTAQCFLNAILAACAEERRAALTEAAELPGNPHSINRDAILALRDRAWRRSPTAAELPKGRNHET